MIRVLVVEDDAAKAQRIVEVVAGVPGVGADACTVVPDVIAAKRSLLETRFDVLLLDLMLPKRFGEVSSPDAGARLLQELVRSEALKRPRFVVGITAFEEVADQHSDVFASHLFGLVRYDQKSLAWQSALKNLLGHAIASSDPSVNLRRADLVVVCALEDPELKALLSLSLGWGPISDALDSSTYHEALLLKEGERRRIVAVACPQMGMSAAASITMKAICRFSPTYIAMCGIAAGVRGKCSVGDVIVADPSWDHGSGKITATASGESEFLMEPTQISLDPLIKTQLRKVAADQGFLARVRSAWVGRAPESALAVRFGPVASGAAVLDADSSADEVKSQNRKLMAIDMETYGVYMAAMHARYPRPKWFSAKSVCDFAANKDDAWQPYAAYTSAAVLVEWARRFV